VIALKEMRLRADSVLAALMRNHLSMRQIVLAGLSLALLGVLCASPSLLGDRVRTAVEGLDAARPAWLWVAGLAFAGTSACGALAWRAAIRAGGTPLAAGDATARYCVGTGVNAIAPAHVGSALRVALFGRVTNGGCWAVAGAAAAVGVTRVVWLGGLLALGCASGVLPSWPLLAIGAIVAAAVAVATFSRHVRLPLRVEQTLATLQGLAGSPRDLVIVAGWALAGATIKIAATAAVVTALGIEHPLRVALIVVPAVELAAVMPITPGNVGVASAAVAFVLAAEGVPSDVALSAGVAFGAVELLAAMAVGAAGALCLAGSLFRPYVRFAIATAAYGTVLCAFSLTVVLPAV
jgi:uncharacterized membrane protein YbhN (UPF0104 family)